MNFTKEAVALPAAHAQPSLLSATLLASQALPAAGEGAHASSRERHHRGSGSGRESPTHTTRHVSGYAVAEVRVAWALGVALLVPAALSLCLTPTLQLHAAPPPHTHTHSSILCRLLL